MTGTVNVYIPRDSNGDPLLSPVARGARGSRKVPSLAVLTFADPDAPRNLANAIPITDKRYPSHKPATFGRVAPRGWHLRPVTDQAVHDRPEPVAPVVEPEAERPSIVREQVARITQVRAGGCSQCEHAPFRTPVGLAWHVEHVHTSGMVVA